MATERTVEHTDGTVEHVRSDDTVVTTGRSGGGGMGMVVAAVVGIALVLIVGYFLMNMNRNDAIKTDAVSSAAESVGNAADNVGDAARNAVPSSN